MIKNLTNRKSYIIEVDISRPTVYLDIGQRFRLGRQVYEVVRSIDDVHRCQGCCAVEKCLDMPMCLDMPICGEMHRHDKTPVHFELSES